MKLEELEGIRKDLKKSEEIRKNQKISKKLEDKKAGNQEMEE